MASPDYHAPNILSASSWENTSPLDFESRSIKTRQSEEAISGSSRPVRNPLRSPSGTSLNRATSRDAIAGPGKKNSFDSGPQSRRIGELNRKMSDLSRSASDPDNIADLYGQARIRSNSKGEFLERTGNGVDQPEENLDNKWIHRDKLAKIESEELQAAGITLPAPRKMSRARKRTTSRDTAPTLQNGMEEMPTDPTPDVEIKTTPPPIEYDDDEEAYRMDWDLRTPEEIEAARLDEKELPPPPPSRKGGSRIPIFTSSPLPINSGVIERNSPLPRKRNTSSGGEEDDLRYGSSRSRANSVGSQVLLDDFETTSRPATRNGLSQSPSKNSAPPPKSVAPSAGSTPGARKTSVSSTARKSSGPQKPRSTSGNRRTQSKDDRPKTAVKAPEGDPPWLTNAYKPDPSIPPDQQIIPTHARKLQQQAWQNSGAIPTAYDRDFSPLAVHTSEGLKPNVSPPKSPDKKNDSTADKVPWPLQTSTSNTHRPGTSGGYTTMPNVKASPPVGLQSPKLETGLANQPQPIRQPALPEETEKEVEKKGCGCCIVM